MIRFKPIAACVMGLIIVLQSLSLLYVQCEFNMNHAYISRVLCINRDKPQMHCDGKCFLKKEVNRSADQQRNDQKTITSFSIHVLFMEQPFNHPFFPVKSGLSKIIFQSYIHAGYPSAPDHPPIA